MTLLVGVSKLLFGHYQLQLTTSFCLQSIRGVAHADACKLMAINEWSMIGRTLLDRLNTLFPRRLKRN